LAAFLSQKAARMRAIGMANSFDCPHATAFLEAAATRHLGEGKPTIELRALMSGERIVATLGGLAQAGRFCGMFISYDADPEISRCSPGQLLVLETIRDLGARGFATFDLGVGEARYKDENCETDEPLFDTMIAATPLGVAFGWAMMTGRQVKRWIKRTPWAWSLVDGLRRRAYFLRNGRALAGAR
jgi:CelD/BcsL family acetyltransferase involved in cellulose biosynthesis